MTGRARVGGLVLAAALVVGAVASVAAGSGPRNTKPPLDRTRLRAGPCADAGAALADSHRRVGDLLAGVATPAGVADPLTADQDPLAALSHDRGAAGPAGELVQEIGLLRIGVDAGSYVASVGADLQAAQHATEVACGAAT